MGALEMEGGGDLGTRTVERIALPLEEASIPMQFDDFLVDLRGLDDVPPGDGRRAWGKHVPHLIYVQSETDPLHEPACA